MRAPDTIDIAERDTTPSREDTMMAAKGANDIADDDLEPLADETARQAQRVVAAYANDADECRMLLSMLGIGPSNRSE
ncbi:hypothetical protein [Nocardia wallacei]|uniref:Uncharacterized protein n=3 Tax=Nocardia wallacei TaxID=480035 RepID=A0A7G1KC87_9NOCA|nr:hypothetical protein [Nocardia wallacei]BCK52782.1 hypothetical protein NWFMUON74_05540 [Nocardia wallacei]